MENDPSIDDLPVPWMIYLYLPLKNGDVHVFLTHFFHGDVPVRDVQSSRESVVPGPAGWSPATMEDHLTVTSFSTYGFNSVMYSVCYKYIYIYIITYIAIYIYIHYIYRYSIYILYYIHIYILDYI